MVAAARFAWADSGDGRLNAAAANLPATRVPEAVLRLFLAFIVVDYACTKRAAGMASNDLFW